MVDNKERVLLSTDDLAEMLQIPARTLSQYRYLGKGPVYLKLGGEKGHVRYRREDVDRWLDEQAVSR